MVLFLKTDEAESKAEEDERKVNNHEFGEVGCEEEETVIEVGEEESKLVPYGMCNCG